MNWKIDLKKLSRISTEIQRDGIDGIEGREVPSSEDGRRGPGRVGWSSQRDQEHLKSSLRGKDRLLPRFSSGTQQMSK